MKSFDALSIRVPLVVKELRLALAARAGDGSRTRVTSLENWDNSRYMTPAMREVTRGNLLTACELKWFILVISEWRVLYTLVYDTCKGVLRKSKIFLHSTRIYKKVNWQYSTYVNY